MTTLVLSFVVLGLVITGMAIGVIMGRKPIAGSCGGLANVGIEGKCSICGDDPQKCDDEQEKQKKKAEIADMAYEVK
ncbi:(Na+)-NQR maturation NqrM [Amphritea balenae]|uniref:(Na+)-NQR maturation NqrM n=1 Tax=Amphritea balenae TaxID=452629 RepID=A0A3P1SU92_9GAMM|nr:(Na+)-NQR maturation NqrM [Amphritea balenae]RRD00660.1 (Na+)-NQR maturation NqrM [Amphritea balenae]GGK68957.1 hypothetical protein GCM10007941_18850 [Amphritea balenae]